jgi:hypothetical protein
MYGNERLLSSKQTDDIFPLRSAPETFALHGISVSICTILKQWPRKIIILEPDKLFGFLIDQLKHRTIFQIL